MLNFIKKIKNEKVIKELEKQSKTAWTRYNTACYQLYNEKPYSDRQAEFRPVANKFFEQAVTIDKKIRELRGI